MIPTWVRQTFILTNGGTQYSGTITKEICKVLPLTKDYTALTTHNHLEGLKKKKQQQPQ